MVTNTRLIYLDGALASSFMKSQPWVGNIPIYQVSGQLHDCDYLFV